MSLSKSAELILEIISDTTKHLSNWLTKLLPLIDNDWWEKLVIPSFSPSYIQKLEIEKLFDLNALNITDIIKIIEFNWYSISENMNLGPQEKFYFTEIQTIRNRWIHFNSINATSNDISQDLDTLYHLLKVIECDKTLNDKVNKLKHIIEEINTKNVTNPETKIILINKNISEPQKCNLQKGDIVFLKSNPEKMGAVIDIIFEEDTIRVSVFLDNKIQQFFLSQLLLKEEKVTQNTIRDCKLFCVNEKLDLNVHPILKND